VSAPRLGRSAYRTTGSNWTRGYKTYRKGTVVGFVPPLERLAVREISPRFLSQEERIEMADLRHAGLSIRQIAARLGRAPSTISRELRRKSSGRGGYRPFDAHRQATARRGRDHPRRIDTNDDLRELVAEFLAQRRNPQQITRHLKGRFPDDRSMWLCHESIYQAVYQPGSPLLRPSRVAPQHRSPLRSGRDHRRAHQKVERRRPRFAQPMLSVHERPLVGLPTNCIRVTNLGPSYRWRPTSTGVVRSAQGATGTGHSTGQPASRHATRIINVDQNTVLWPHFALADIDCISTSRRGQWAISTKRE
jgi:transposase-like protein